MSSVHALQKEGWLTAILAVVRERFGQVVPERRMGAFRQAVLEAYVTSGTSSLDDYRDRVSSDPLESPLVADLLGRITIKESYFFRDEVVMSALRALVLPRLLAKNSGTRRLSIWSAGCSNGEEPYTLSILIDQILPGAPGWTIRIVGTDIDDGSLRAAARGEYGEWSVRGLAAGARERLFERKGGKLRLVDRHRRWVRFETLNLADEAASPPEPGTFDLVLCRNVGIYLSDEASAVLYDKLAGALAPHGLIVTAPSDPRPPARAGLASILLRTATQTTLGYALDPLFWDSTSRAPRAPSVPSLASLPSTAPPAPAPTEPPLVEPLPVALSPSAPERANALPVECALSLIATGDREGAVKVLGNAIDAAPLDSFPYFVLALIAIDGNDHAAAEAHLKQVLYLAPDFAEAHYRLGLLLARRGDVVGGRRSLLAALRVTRAAGSTTPALAAAIGAQLARMEKKR